MEHKYFFPHDIKGERAWLLNYKTEIATVGPLCGLSPAEVTAEETACQAMINGIDAADAALTASATAVQDRDDAIALKMKPILSAIGAMKNNSGYTDTLGKQIKVIGSEVIVDRLTVKTTVKLAKTPLGVDIKFTLEHCDGGDVYSKRGAETEFTFLKSITHPHTIDTRPNLAGAATEQRQYYVTLTINDVEVGIPSAPETINF